MSSNLMDQPQVARYTGRAGSVTMEQDLDALERTVELMEDTLLTPEERGDVGDPVPGMKRELEARSRLAHIVWPEIFPPVEGQRTAREHMGEHHINWYGHQAVLSPSSSPGYYNVWPLAGGSALATGIPQGRIQLMYPDLRLKPDSSD